MSSWIQDNQTLLWSLTALSGFIFFATLIAVPLLIARLPADHFAGRPTRGRGVRRPARRLVLVILKNGVGLVLVLAGLAMLVLPGQGLLAILVGIMLLDFPGKRRVERWLIRRRPIFRAANWLRRKRRQPPLKLPEV